MASKLLPVDKEEERKSVFVMNCGVRNKKTVKKKKEKVVE